MSTVLRDRKGVLLNEMISVQLRLGTVQLKLVSKLESGSKRFGSDDEVKIL